MLHSPQAADRFVIEARVGGGAAGDIYKAVDTANGQPVALKLLRASATESERARFLREIAVIADLRHPNIVDYVSHGVWSDGRAFMAMEWLDGDDLSVRQRRAPLGMRDAVEVVRRAAQALAAIHTRGIVHRDLKLSNIFLVTGRGTAVKLIDFGVVRPSEPDGFTTEPGTIIGTPHYMAPEQARGEDVDPRSDVYSLASVLFRLVTGRNVFVTEHVIALLGRLVLEDPPHPSSVRFDVPESLDAVIHQCLARDPALRLPNAGDFARALARVGPLNNDPPAERSASQVVPRRVHEEPADSSDAPSVGGGGARPSLSVRRVVACMLYDLGDTPSERSIGDSLVDLTGEDVRIEQLAGGKTVAVLGVQFSRGDEVLRAARAALAIVAEYPAARAVVSSGYAIMARANLAGAALDQAATQLQHAHPGAVRLGPTAAAALDGHFEMHHDTAGAVLVRESPHDLAPRNVLGRPTPTVGREKIITQLQGLYAETLHDAFPRAALVVGAPGIGKSRIRSELLQRLEMAPQPPEVLVCRSDHVPGGASSVTALGKALRAQMGVQDGAQHVEQVNRVKRFIAERLPRSLQFLAAFMGELVGVPFPDLQDEPLRAARADAQLMQSRIRMAIEAYVRTQSSRAPQVLVLEDAQWADGPTLSLLEWLLVCPDIRFAVYAFARPEIDGTHPDLWLQTRRTRVDLRPISVSAAERIVATVAPALDADVRADIILRAAGNPLVLEELLRCAAEGRHELPLTVQALMQQRLDRLAPGVQDVLRAAAVFGQIFWSSGIAALLGRDVQGELEQAEQAEVILRQPTSSVAGQTEWVFRQSLVRDAANESLLAEERAPLRLAAGEWLEAVDCVDLGMIARHFEEGGDNAKAATLYARATLQARKNFGQMLAALELARRGLACGAQGGERAQLLLTMAEAYNRMGRLSEGIASADEAARLVPAASAMWVEAQRLLAASLIESGRAGEGDGRASWALGEQFRDRLSPAMRSTLLSTRVRALIDLNRTAQALAVADEAVEASRQAGNKTDAALLRALDARLFALMSAGQPEAALGAGSALLDAADRVGNLHLSSRARLNMASTLNYLGQYEQAQQLIEAALPDVRSYRLRLLEALAIHNLGMSYARRGSLDPGIDMQREAARIADECAGVRLGINTRIYETLMLTWRGAPGDLKRAHELAEYLLQATQTQLGLQVIALYTLARVQLARQHIDDAIEAAREAHRRLNDGPVEEWDEGIRLCFIEALLHGGRTEEADGHIRDAFALLGQRLAGITRPEYRASFVSRNQEVASLLRLAHARLGLTLG